MITESKLRQATNSLKTNKAPGPDKVPNEILKEVTKFRPEIILNAFKKCITQAGFPAIWKTARLVLLRKGINL